MESVPAIKSACITEGKNIGGVFVTKAPENNWSIQLKHKIPCMWFDLSDHRFGSVLSRLVRLRIYWDDSKILEDLLKKSLF